MANASTKSKLHEKLEDIILNSRRRINQIAENGSITSLRAEKIRLEIQKQIDVALDGIRKQVADEISRYVTDGTLEDN